MARSPIRLFAAVLLALACASLAATLAAAAAMHPTLRTVTSAAATPVRVHDHSAAAAAATADRSDSVSLLWYRIPGFALVGTELASFNTSAAPSATLCWGFCSALSPACVGFNFQRAVQCTLFSAIDTMVGAGQSQSRLGDGAEFEEDSEDRPLGEADLAAGGAECGVLPTAARPFTPPIALAVGGYDLFANDVQTPDCGDRSTWAGCSACCAKYSQVCDAFTFIAPTCYPKAFNQSGPFYNRGEGWAMGLMPIGARVGDDAAAATDANPKERGTAPKIELL